MCACSRPGPGAVGFQQSLAALALADLAGREAEGPAVGLGLGVRIRLQILGLWNKGCGVWVSGLQFVEGWQTQPGRHQMVVI